MPIEGHEAQFGLTMVIFDDFLSYKTESLVKKLPKSVQLETENNKEL